MGRFWVHVSFSWGPFQSYWVLLMLSCFCILLQQYRLWGLEPCVGGYMFLYFNATISHFGPGVFGWGHRKPRWSHLGSSACFLDRVGASLGRLGIILACLRSLFIRIGCVLCCPAFVFCWSSIAFWVLSPWVGPTWAASRSSRAVLVFFSDRVGANLTRCWDHFGLSWGHFGWMAIVLVSKTVGSWAIL